MYLIKNFYTTIRFFLVIAISFSSISLKSQPINKVAITYHFDQPAQKIEGFGASDAWNCQFAGLWPDEKKNKAANLLFSTKTDENGNPLGIGLSIWRFSIGAGSAQQGDLSGIKDVGRRQEAFLNTDGSYNKAAMKGQLWFMQAAKNCGVKKFLGFVNSPHVNFTLNHKAFSADGKCNLNFNQLDNFCDDLVQTIKIIQQKANITLDYISPVNEPQWKWNDGGQEGCPYNNEQIAQVVKRLDQKLEASHLPTKIQIGEAGQINFLTNSKDSLKGNQVNYFFNPSSVGYVGNLKNIDQSISAHSYFSTSPEDKAIKNRILVGEAIGKIPNLRYWMSEYCVLGDATLKGEGRDLGMTTALFIAKLIHQDLVYANATSWQWWLALSGGNYKDGLVYFNKNDNTVYDSKLLWSFGNYSRFIPEGSTRIPVSVSVESQLYISAYLKENQLITVIVNDNDLPINLNLNGYTDIHKKLKIYTTSALSNLSFSTRFDTNVINLPAKSVTTVIGFHQKP